MAILFDYFGYTGPSIKALLAQISLMIGLIVSMIAIADYLMTNSFKSKLTDKIIVAWSYLDDMKKLPFITALKSYKVLIIMSFVTQISSILILVLIHFYARPTYTFEPSQETRGVYAAFPERENYLVYLIFAGFLSFAIELFVLLPRSFQWIAKGSRPITILLRMMVLNVPLSTLLIFLLLSPGLGAFSGNPFYHRTGIISTTELIIYLFLRSYALSVILFTLGNFAVVMLIYTSIAALNITTLLLSKIVEYPKGPVLAFGAALSTISGLLRS